MTAGPGSGGVLFAASGGGERGLRLESASAPSHSLSAAYTGGSGTVAWGEYHKVLSGVRRDLVSPERTETFSAALTVTLYNIPRGEAPQSLRVGTPSGPGGRSSAGRFLKVAIGRLPWDAKRFRKTPPGK